MKTISSTTREEDTPHSHLVQSGEGSAGTRLDQALEGDQQHRREREAVLRSWLGHTHRLRMAGLQMAMLWFPCLVFAAVLLAAMSPGEAGALLAGVLMLPVGPWPSLSFLSQLLLVPVLVIPFLAPLSALAAECATQHLLQRGRGEGIEINRVDVDDPGTGQRGGARREVEVQRQLDALFGRELEQGSFSVGALAVFPAAAALFAWMSNLRTLAHLYIDQNVMGTMVLTALAITSFLLVPESLMGLRTAYRRRALLEKAEAEGLTVRDPARSPWS